MGFVNAQDYEEIVVDEARSEEGWNNLVIDKSIKKALKALVSDHAMTSAPDKQKKLSRSGTGIDVIHGKGRGRIIYIYGPPGVGRTSTAETIAAFTVPPRPLYPITCGDIGTDAKVIRESLEGHFKLAHRWNCVLLLDEADRNGIVSVFLRTLEYFSGLLFLTSNRVGSIDPAVKSRIHLALQYNKIDIVGTEKIWDNILNTIERDNRSIRIHIEVDFHRETLLDWARAHFDKMENKFDLPTWNGRQIRNAFQIALALAAYERQEKMVKSNLTKEKLAKKKTHSLKKISLTEKHLRQVSKIITGYE